MSRSYKWHNSYWANVLIHLLFTHKLTQKKSIIQRARVQRIHSSARIYEYKMGKDEWFFWHGRLGGRVITKNQTLRNTQFFHQTVSLVNFIYLPDQTKFYRIKVWRDTTACDWFHISIHILIRGVLFPAMVFSLFFSVLVIQITERGFDLNDMQPRFTLANRGIEKFLEWENKKRWSFE